MKIIAILLFNLSIMATTVVTYNAGLAHTYVPYASERISYIVDALKKESADVLCLQEVWRAEDRAYLIKELSSEYQFTHFEKVEQNYATKKPVCKLKNLFGKKKFVTCTMKKCKKKSGDDFTSCVINECREPLNRLKNDNRQCAKALMAQVGKSSLKSIWAVINPFKAASLFSYGGGNGLLLLSKKPISNKSVVDMSDVSTLNRRAALTADVEDLGTVKCAHLTADLDLDAPYAGNFSSWSQENKVQVERLVKSARAEKSIVMGDFNCGPEMLSYNLKGELANNCEILSNNLYDSLSEINPECTFCSSNILADVKDDMMIDHIYTSDDLRPRSAEVIFKEKIIIEGEETNLSDHYGIKANF